MAELSFRLNIAVAASLAVGIALAGAFTPSASSWQFRDDHGDRFTHGRGPLP